MRRLLPNVLVLHSRERVLRLVRDSAPEGLFTLPVASWDALLEAASTASAGSVAMVDPFFGEEAVDEGAPRLAMELRDLRNHFPGLPVIAAWAVRVEHHAQLRQLGAWGIGDVLDLSTGSNPATVRRRLEQGRRSVTERILAVEARSRLSAYRSGLVARALDVTIRGGLSDEWAREEEVSARTLLRPIVETVASSESFILFAVRSLCMAISFSASAYCFVPIR